MKQIVVGLLVFGALQGCVKSESVKVNVPAEVEEIPLDAARAYLEGMKVRAHKPKGYKCEYRRGMIGTDPDWAETESWRVDSHELYYGNASGNEQKVYSKLSLTSYKSPHLCFVIDDTAAIIGDEKAGQELLQKQQKIMAKALRALAAWGVNVSETTTGAAGQ